MKKSLHLLMFFVSFSAAVAQVPGKMTYQAVLRYSNNGLVANKSIVMKVSILQGSASGTSVYSETHNTSTNPNGLVTIEIGGGVNQSGALLSVDWSNGPFFLKTETDPQGGNNFTITSTSQLLSVPYAFYAGKSGNGMPSGNQIGQMLYWDGEQWKFIAPGQPGQFLQMTTQMIPGWAGIPRDSLCNCCDSLIVKIDTLKSSSNADWRNVVLIGSTDGSSNDIDICASAWTIGGNPSYIRGHLKFSLNTVPANATIISAKLSLYSNPTPINGNLTDANSGSNNAFYIRRITSSWVGNTLTWATMPTTTTEGQILIPHTSSPSLDLIDIDVTNLVKAMRAAGNDYGFVIQLVNESAYNARQFCSSNHSNVSKRPRLILEYK